MKSLTKILIIIIALIIIANIIYFTNFTANVVSEKEPVKIGIILPLTGEIASLGEGAKNGGLLGYKDLSKSQKEKIQIIFEDDQFNPKNSVSAFNKLVNVDKASVVVCFTSGPCNAIAPLAEENKIPLIAIASDPKIQKDKKFVVRLEIAPSEEAKLLLNYIEKKKYKKIASVVALQDGIKAGYAELLKDKKYSDTEVFTETVNANEKDFRTIITKIISKNPDVIFVGLVDGPAGDFGRQARTLGYKGDFIGLNFLEGEETLKSAQGKLDGIIYTNAKEPQGWFNEEYNREYGKSPGPGSANLYDSIQILGKTAEQGMTSNVEIASYLSSLRNYNGALGIFSSTETHEFTIPVELKTVKGNKFVRYGGGYLE